MELQDLAFGQSLDAFLSESPSFTSTHSESSFASDVTFFSSADSYLYGPLATGKLPTTLYQQHPRSSADLYPYGWLPPEPPWLDLETHSKGITLRDEEINLSAKQLLGLDANEKHDTPIPYER
ncbi:hypothetical protein FRB98_005443, partial [Tulasnella sp. 332]